MTVFPLDPVAPSIVSNGVPVAWTEGFDAMVVASSLCMRVNTRGVYSIPSHWALRDLTSLPGWNVFRCPPSKGSLCGSSPNSLIFPYAYLPRYDGNRTYFPGTPGCTRSTGDGRILTSQRAYDLSACDILDQGGDFVLCQGRTAAYRGTSLATWVYWVLCLLAVYIIRSFSYMVAHRLEPTHPSHHHPHPSPSPSSLHDDDAPAVKWYNDPDTRTVIACLLAFVLVFVPDGDSIYITVEEFIFVVSMVVYMVVYFSVFFIAGGRKLIDPPIYNLIAGTLQLIALRLYTGVQTPYNPVLIWAVATRVFVKFTRTHRISICEQVTLFVDAMILSLMCVLGFDGPATYLVAIFATAITTADVFPGG